MNKRDPAPVSPRQMRCGQLPLDDQVHVRQVRGGVLGLQHRGQGLQVGGAG